MIYRRKFRYSIFQWANHRLGTWFCESASERRFKALLKRLCIGFSQQEKIGIYRVDFLDYHSNIIFEIDGSHHDHQREYDRKRDRVLSMAGYKVIRVIASHLWDDLESVERKVKKLYGL